MIQQTYTCQIFRRLIQNKGKTLKMLENNDTYQPRLPTVEKILKATGHGVETYDANSKKQTI